MNLEFSRQILKNLQIQNLIKIHLFEPSFSMWTDGRTNGPEEDYSRFF